jgi:hypothetical protein
MTMKNSMHLKTLLTGSKTTPGQPLALFALLTLGFIDSLASGLISASDAVGIFFHAQNCLFVRKHLRDKIADKSMSHGVQLPDVFDALGTEEAQREFQHELATMRGFCLKLLEKKRLVA